MLPLPPYAPEWNPMENVWEYMRGNDLSHRVWDGYEAIIAACCSGWNKMQMPNRDRLAHQTLLGKNSRRIGPLVLQDYRIDCGRFQDRMT